MIQVTNPRRFLFICAIVILVVFVALARFVWGPSTVQRSGEIVVSEGMSARKIWKQFVNDGYTTRTLPWRYQEWRQHAGAKIKAGTYRIEKGEKVCDIVKRLIEGDSVITDKVVTYPEGFTLQQVAERTATSNIGTTNNFLTAAHPAEYVKDFPFLSELSSQRTLEGYLFPDTYRLAADDKPSDVVKRMLANFSSKVTSDLREEAKASGRSFDQIIIMASIVEREVTNPDDMAVVAGILWKRLDEGMGLDVDATVRYALNKWDEPLTVDDLASDSPYNTRKFRGLPPGPISNPGLQAIIAAIRPQSSPYYYYLSAPDGKTIFGKTNDEHNANKAKYLR